MLWRPCHSVALMRLSRSDGVRSKTKAAPSVCPPTGRACRPTSWQRVYCGPHPSPLAHRGLVPADVLWNMPVTARAQAREQGHGESASHRSFLGAKAPTVPCVSILCGTLRSWFLLPYRLQSSSPNSIDGSLHSPSHRGVFSLVNTAFQACCLLQGGFWNSECCSRETLFPYGRHLSKATEPRTFIHCACRVALTNKGPFDAQSVSSRT